VGALSYSEQQYINFVPQQTMNPSLDERRSAVSKFLRDVSPMKGWWFQVPISSIVNYHSELGSLSSLLQVPIDLLKAYLVDLGLLQHTGGRFIFDQKAWDIFCFFVLVAGINLRPQSCS
jgi:hypothetical protein